MEWKAHTTHTSTVIYFKRPKEIKAGDWSNLECIYVRKKFPTKIVGIYLRFIENRLPLEAIHFFAFNSP